jgi:type IV pilus assembly protein PilY1
MVYVGANDGMLHAFYTDAGANQGQEAWAYVPNFLFPTLYKLADKYYSSKHEYYVDGTPVRGDIRVDSEWKTILVGGVNLGGKGYYALDVTDPDEPKALWEFTHANLGYTYGNPVITKLNGAWVVLVTSGYNNADGNGYLFVLDAATGEVINTVATGVGSAANPSGLAKISRFATLPNENNTALRVYGGDLLGNVWRFDINSDISAEDGLEAHKLATLADALGIAQPITTRPELSIINGDPVVFIGTGQLLGISDLSTTQTQTLYGIKDSFDRIVSYGNPRHPDISAISFVQQFLTWDADGDGFEDVCPADMFNCPEGRPMISATHKAVDWAKNDAGWYVDFIYEGERSNTDVHLYKGTLVFNTNTPQSGACVPAGKSRYYNLNYETGGAVNVCDDEYCKVAFLEDDNLATSVTITVDGGLVQRDGNGVSDEGIDTGNVGKRRGKAMSWRELIIE